MLHKSNCISSKLTLYFTKLELNYIHKQIETLNRRSHVVRSIFLPSGVSDEVTLRLEGDMTWPKSQIFFIFTFFF